MGEHFRSVSPTATLGANEESSYNRASTRPLLTAGPYDRHSDMMNVETLPLNEDIDTGALLAEGAGDRDVEKPVVDGSQYDDPV